MIIDPYEEAEIRERIAKAWDLGQLAWKLRTYQYGIYETIWGLIERLRGGQISADEFRVGVVVACRKIGKSFLEVLISGEFCIRYPGSIVRITAPTAVEARAIFEPEFEKVFSDCPAHLAPKRRGVDQNWHFPNKSMIVLKGADMKPDRLRGPSSDLNWGDEAAYIHRLQYVVDSVLYPMTINTRGPTILCSTLNQSPNAEFNEYYRRCKALGQSAVVTIYDAGFSEAQIQAEKNAVNASTWAVEYECKEERDPDQTIVPEWTPELAAEATVEAPRASFEQPELAYWQRLTAGDWGASDNTVILTGYLDFQTQTLWVTGEELLQGANVTAGNAARVIRGLEAADNEARPMAHDAPAIQRVGDHDSSMLQSLQVDQKVTISPIAKLSTLEAMVNNLRVWIQQGRVKISPKCVNLLACLKHGAWVTAAGHNPEAPRKRVFARSALVDSERRVLGHFDALAAAIYLCLKAQAVRTRNPLPATFITPAQALIHGQYKRENYGMAPVDQSSYTRKQRAPAWLPPGARKR